MLRPVLLAAAIAACLSMPLAANAAQPSSSAPYPVPAVATPKRNAATQALYALFDEEWERDMRESPEEASYRGDKRFNDRWTDMSMAAIQARMEGDRNALQRLRAIDRKALSASDQLNYDVFAWDLEKASNDKYRDTSPGGHSGGVQTAESSPLFCRSRREGLPRLSWRMLALPVVIEQNEALMREASHRHTRRAC